MSIGRFNTERISLQTTIALWFFAGVAAGLGVYSALCPPEGVIDKSIFEFGMLMFGFATLAVARDAIKEGLGLKYTHGDMSIEVNKDSNGQPGNPAEKD